MGNYKEATGNKADMLPQQPQEPREINGDKRRRTMRDKWRQSRIIGLCEVEGSNQNHFRASKKDHGRQRETRGGNAKRQRGTKLWKRKGGTKQNHVSPASRRAMGERDTQGDDKAEFILAKDRSHVKLIKNPSQQSCLRNCTDQVWPRE